MLLQFLVKNFMSIKGEAILSLIPSSDTEHEENICSSGKHSALKMAAIYGANAAGKTSLFKAMTMAIIIVRQSNIRQINDVIPVNPFRFDGISRNEPSKFEFTFVASDGLKYIYGFAADMHRVHEEYLYCYRTNRPSMIFDRTNDEFRFSRSEKKNLEPIVRMNTSNKLFLATATAWNVQSTTIPYEWLSKGIDTYTNDDNIINLSLNMYREHEEECVDFTKKLMCHADINISDVTVKSKKSEQKHGTLDIIINGQQITPQDNYEIQITTGHLIRDDNNNQVLYPLGLHEESLGTQQLFFMAPLLMQAFSEGKVLIIDEIDRSLHPFIVKYLVNLFRDQKMNPNGAQLIFTTHDTTLLSLDTFRKDQVYFSEKSAEKGTSTLYSLDDFVVRKNDNIEKGYLLGRYGAIPFLQTEEIV